MEFFKYIKKALSSLPCFLFLAIFMGLVWSCSKSGNGEEEVKPDTQQGILAGVDLSYVNTIEKKGGVYRDENGDKTDPYQLFASKGANLLRMRLWHTPQNVKDYCGNPIEADDLADVTEAFKRGKDAGMKLLLSIHYGDYFNDPKRQLQPDAWKGAQGQALLDSIYDYTFQVLKHMKDNDVVPYIVSVGNETTNGFVNETEPTSGWVWQADRHKFNSALSAIDDFNKQFGEQVIKAVHFTDKTGTWLIKDFIDHGVDNFDMVGISFYPFYSDSGNFSDLVTLLKLIKGQYNKRTMIFETAYPWTGSNADNYSNFMTDGGKFSYSVSPSGQLAFLNALVNVLKANGCEGVVYWEPAWISSDMCDKWGQGSSFENCSFFDFTNDNKPLQAFDFFKQATGDTQ